MPQLCHVLPSMCLCVRPQVDPGPLPSSCFIILRIESCTYTCNLSVVLCEAAPLRPAAALIYTHIDISDRSDLGSDFGCTYVTLTLPCTTEWALDRVLGLS